MDQGYLEQWTERCREIEATSVPENFSMLVEEAAKNHSGKPAFNAFEDGITLTFDALADQVFRLSSSLAAIGVKQGTHIAVLLPNRLEFPVAWLAIACLGAVMVPANAASTSRELDYLYNDADVEYVIVDKSLVHVIENMDKRPPHLADEQIIVVDGTDGYTDYASLIAGGDPDFRSQDTITSDALLNIQYTSGTTGMPKGCMQSQRFWLVLGCTVAAMEPDINSILADHPFFYIDPQWMVVFALKSGACYYLAKRMSSSRFLDWVTEHPIEFCYFPKPLLNMDPDPREQQHSLKKCTIGAVSRGTLKEGEERLGVSIRQNYGMTEIGAGLMVPDDATDDAIFDTCGLPTPFRRLRIVDQQGNDVPDGEPGELIVNGDGIFLGYYNKPEANKNSFYGDWFRTGDVFVRTPEGYYKIIGRTKDMIRRSNENISALEVEQAVNEFDPIAEAAVVPVPDEYRGEEVKLYVRLKEGVSAADVSPEDILEHCTERLAAFKHPRFIEYVKEFPYTPSQKIAKNKLTLGCADLRANAWDALEKKIENKGK